MLVLWRPFRKFAVDHPLSTTERQSVAARETLITRHAWYMLWCASQSPLPTPQGIGTTFSQCDPYRSHHQGTTTQASQNTATQRGKERVGGCCSLAIKTPSPIPKHMGPQPTALYHIGFYMLKTIQKTPKNTQKHTKCRQKAQNRRKNKKPCFFALLAPGPAPGYPTLAAVRMDSMAWGVVNHCLGRQGGANTLGGLRGGVTVP